MNPPAAAAERVALLRKFRGVLLLFMVALILSGLTALPLQRELELAAGLRGLDRAAPADAGNGLDRWMLTVRDGLRESYARHPWLAYGTDWLAFAHLAIALFFLGPLLDPARNVWVLQAGIIACVLVVPWALVSGAVRQIPWGWRLLDCSFGIIGAMPLCYCLRLARALQRNPAQPVAHP